MIHPTIPLLISLLYVLGESTKPCGVMTGCAIQKCVDKKEISRLIRQSPREALFGNIVTKFDMVCIATKCGKKTTPNKCSRCGQFHCRLMVKSGTNRASTSFFQQCKVCQYALEQMAALASGEKTSGLCPKLEGCVRGCITENIEEVLICVAERCNVHCYDGDCPPCKSISKRMFSHFCKENNLTDHPNIQFEGKCPELFEMMADEFVNRARSV